MGIRNNFRHTRFACYLGYIIQAIVNNYAPLLFITFNQVFEISLEKIATISAFNFFVQLFVDFLAAKYADQIGYRKMVVAAQLFAAIGLFGYGILPFVLGDAFIGLLLSAFFCAIGGGLIEVMISPIVEACPTDSKSGSMSLLHSFYCWGQAGVVLLSTLFFSLAGLDNWHILAMIWGMIPLLNALYFLQVPLNKVVSEEEKISPKELFSGGMFKILILLMLCAGASELAMSQWASAFAEAGLGVSKSVGDLTGPCLFAILMGIVRVGYSLFSRKIKLVSFMMGSGVLCIIGYLFASLSPSPVLSLIGCALCGISVSMLWPGTISIAAKLCPRGGTFMFGILALAGDLGCVCGTGLVGFVSGLFGDNLKIGMLFATIFPVLLLIGLGICHAHLIKHPEKF